MFAADFQFLNMPPIWWNPQDRVTPLAFPATLAMQIPNFSSENPPFFTVNQQGSNRGDAQPSW